MTTTTDPETQTALDTAVEEYVARRQGHRQPAGTWTHGVWLPDDDERRPCCRIHLPTNQPGNPACYPEAARHHCTGYEHVARLYGVKASALKRAVRAARA